MNNRHILNKLKLQYLLGKLLLVIQSVNIRFGLDLKGISFFFSFYLGFGLNSFLVATSQTPSSPNHSYLYKELYRSVKLFEHGNKSVRYVDMSDGVLPI